MTRIPLHHLLLPVNVVAGCNLGVIASLAHMLRSTTDDPPPIVVRRTVDGLWRISDGRHRFAAALIAGRPDVLAEEER